MLDLNITSERTDEVLKKTYQVAMVDALELSDYLKTLYSERGIDTSLVDSGGEDHPERPYGEVDYPNLKLKFHKSEGFSRSAPSHFYLENDDIKIEPETSYDSYYTSVKRHCGMIKESGIRVRDRKVVTYIKKPKSDWTKFKKEYKRFA